MRIASLMFLISITALAGTGGGPAVYVVGNLDGVSPGDEGTLVLDRDAVVFRSGKTVLTLHYTDIHNVELGTRVVPPADAPLYKVWRLPKRFLTDRGMHQMVNFQFADKDGDDQTMTLEFEETAANQTLAEIEIRQGKRTPPKRATNGDPWWGDSAWKTPRNNNTVSPQELGGAAPESRPADIQEPSQQSQARGTQVSLVGEPAPAKPLVQTVSSGELISVKPTPATAKILEPAPPSPSKQSQAPGVKGPVKVTNVVAESSATQPPWSEPTRPVVTQKIAARDISHDEELHRQMTSKDKPTLNIRVVDTQTSEREFTQYIPGTPGTASTNCNSNATVYGTGGGMATANGTTNCTTTTSPGREASTVRSSIEQAHVRAIMPDGRHITLWCQQGFRRCSKLSTGYYAAELSGNSVWMQVYDLDGTTKHKVKYRFEGGW